MEQCLICGCLLHRDGEYAEPTPKGRSHASEHHFVAERFFGRTGNRRRSARAREAIFVKCPWNAERKTGVFCYDCHEEILHNPVMLLEDITAFARLASERGLSEPEKTDRRDLLAGRIQLLHEVIVAGLAAVVSKDKRD